MNFQSIDKKDVVTDVFNQLKEKIETGAWKVGDKIPSETQLTQMFNVSRVSVRSAIQRLRDIGVIKTYQGKGSFVSSKMNSFGFNELGSMMHLTEKEFRDMMVFRETIEFSCIDLVIANATSDDLNEIEEALSEMIQHRGEYKEYSQADYDFHLAIVKASQNKVFYDVFVSIKDFYYYYLEELNRVIGVTPQSVDTHIQMVEALKNRDAERAKALLTSAMKSNNSILYEKGNWQE